MLTGINCTEGSDTTIVVAIFKTALVECSIMINILNRWGVPLEVEAGVRSMEKGWLGHLH